MAERSQTATPIRRDPLNPLLATKVRPPRSRLQLVSRPHLVRRLQAGAAGLLTLISAPAGFGKTTLLAQWAAESATPVAWLSLEPEDNDPIRFLVYLVAAIRTHYPDLDLNVPALLEAPHTEPLEGALALLSNALMNQGSGSGGLALVLDDYQVVEASSIHRALTFLLDHPPPRLHLVLATRVDPPLPLARLRGRDQLNELRAADLRLSTSESQVFLQTVMGLDLPSEAVAALQHRTEGWVAGLQLAGISLRGRDDVSTFVAAFTGSHRFVLDYLSQEVLGRQPAPVLSFLLRTSVLERLCGPLCDAVIGEPGGQAMLESLERSNLFLAPLDEDRCWYRYHQLFAELLRSRLERTQPELIPQLHRRASLWYEQRDQLTDAVHHALAGGAVEDAARLIQQCGSAMFAGGRTRLLLDWVDSLPDAVVRGRPLLCLFHATALHLSDRLEEAQARLQDGQGAPRNGSPAEHGAVQGLAAAVRANFARYSGDLEQALAHARRTLDLMPSEQPVFRAAAAVTEAHAFLVTGDVTSKTERQVRSAVAAARTSGHLLVHFRSLTLLARLQALQGRLRAAVATCEEAGSASPDEFLQVVSASAVYCFVLGDLMLEWNHLGEAERLLTRGMEQVSGRRSVFGDDLIIGYLTWVRLHRARGSYDHAAGTLDSLAQLVETRRFPGHFGALVHAARAQVQLARGDRAAAVAWADASGLSCRDDQLPYRHEWEYLTLARVRIAQGREDRSRPWLRETLLLLDRLLAQAEVTGRSRSALEVLILRALTLDALAERDDALSTLHHALLRASPEGYVRLFVDEGPPMRALLRGGQARGTLPNDIAILLSAFGDLDAPESQRLAEPLTRREREVLRMLSDGASNREIALRLFVSVNTVKRHVYNICGKLGVQSRVKAIARARSLRLLDGLS